MKQVILTILMLLITLPIQAQRFITYNEVKSTVTIFAGMIMTQHTTLNKEELSALVIKHNDSLTDPSVISGEYFLKDSYKELVELPEVGSVKMFNCAVTLTLQDVNVMLKIKLISTADEVLIFNDKYCDTNDQETIYNHVEYVVKDPVSGEIITVEFYHRYWNMFCEDVSYDDANDWEKDVCMAITPLFKYGRYDNVTGTNDIVPDGS